MTIKLDNFPYLIYAVVWYTAADRAMQSCYGTNPPMSSGATPERLPCPVAGNLTTNGIR